MYMDVTSKEINDLTVLNLMKTSDTDNFQHFDEKVWI